MVALTHSEITIAASPAAVMDVIADLPNYPSWSSEVVAAEVLERNEAGRPLRAHMEFDVGLFRESYELAYRWQGNDQVDWELVQGGVVTTLTGTYTCADNGDGTTTVGYDLALELMVPLIGSVQSKGQKRIVRSALRRLRDRVEETSTTGG